MKQSSSQQALGDLFIPTTPAKEAHDLLVFEGQANSAAGSWAFIKDRPLETCYDLLCDSSTFVVGVLGLLGQYMHLYLLYISSINKPFRHSQGR